MDTTSTIYIIIGIIALLFIIIAFCVTVHTAIRMREAFLRGKMLQQRCGEEYYEAETIRYQIYDEWINKKANLELGASSWILISATMAVVILYIGIFLYTSWYDDDYIVTSNSISRIQINKFGFINNNFIANKHFIQAIFTVLIVGGTLAYCLYTALLLNPNQGATGYYTDGDLSIGNRIGGIITHLVVLLFILPLILIVIYKYRISSQNFGDTFNEFFKDKTPYAVLLLLLVGLLLFAFINLGFGVYIKDAIHSDYYDERINTEATTRLPTHILQKVIDNVVKNVGNATIAGQSQSTASQAGYDSEKYKFYKMIYNGIRDVDKPNSVSEGDIKKGAYANPAYPILFKYILHSKQMDKLLRDPDVLATATTPIVSVDVTDKYKNMGSSDESLGQAVNSFYTAVMIIFGAIIGIIVLIIYRNIVQSSSMYIIPIVSIVFLLMLGSLIYAYMSGVLLG